MLRKPKQHLLQTLMICLMISTLYPAVSGANQVKLAWDPPAISDDGSQLNDLAGYIIYYGTAPQQYMQGFDVGNVTAGTFGFLAPGQTYYFTVTAYDSSENESRYSAELSAAAVMNDTSPSAGETYINISLNQPKSGGTADDGDGISADGDGSGIAGDNLCTGGNTSACDDNCVLIANPDQADADGDGAGDACDNCRLVSNPDQNDDNSGEDDNASTEGIQHYGNICDPDIDNDGMVSIQDYSVWRIYYRQGISTAPAYMDFDNDGVIGISDYGIWRKYYRGAPGPGMG